ncbi:Hypp4727 [Branchiostoma lanceolatum]|uniref:Hypp4727 protein n=1 Tax=Branchiostoma lanceolatum TaxID=7740 RepID=A0A8K0ACI0_BRALA|nr:Hypp4727 [Branchiostoma lanceolatum]
MPGGNTDAGTRCGGAPDVQNSITNCWNSDITAALIGSGCLCIGLDRPPWPPSDGSCENGLYPVCAGGCVLCSCGSVVTCLG